MLTVVQANWALSAGTTTDVGPASVAGARALIDGRPVYGVDRAQVRELGSDPHYDTYGPVVYEAYVPFVALAGDGKTPARWAALAFTLLTAALLYRLGGATRSRRTGVLLAFAWLSFPLTLYAGRLTSNDALVAATLVAALLAASSPARRGVAAALAALTKFTPLALVPVLLASGREGRPGRASVARFAGAFLLTGAALLAPALVHSSPSTFLARTVGFQLTRAPGFTVWEELDYLSGSGAPWLHSAGAVLHGLAIACVGAYALALARLPRAPGVAGLAAACAAVLIGVELCDGYFLLSYTLWFVPLVLSAAILSGPPPVPRRGPRGSAASASSGVRSQPTTVSSRGRLVSTS